MTTRFKRLLWKTAIKLHKQTQGDKTSLKRQKQHKESQNTKKTGYRHKGSSAVETRWVLSASWEILQLSVQQDSSAWTVRPIIFVCTPQMHAITSLLHITAGFMYFLPAVDSRLSAFLLISPFSSSSDVAEMNTCWHTGLTSQTLLEKTINIRTPRWFLQV